MTAEEIVAERIRRLVDEAPPLSLEVMERLRRLLPPAPGEMDLSELAGAEPAA